MLLVGCLNQPQSAALVQQTASEFNVNTRFGRMEMAGENVAPNYRDEFARVHNRWGGDVRIADSELAGMQMRAKEEAEVLVRVSWFRTDEGDLHSTAIRQTWRDHHGMWMLEREERLSGDFGLLGERVEFVAPESRAAHAQFPSVRIGADD